MAKDQRFEKVYSQGMLETTEIWVDKKTGVNSAVKIRNGLINQRKKCISIRTSIDHIFKFDILVGVFIPPSCNSIEDRIQYRTGS